MAPSPTGCTLTLRRNAELRFGKVRRESPVHADSEIGAPLSVMPHSCSVKGVLPKLISASDVGQTFLSAGSGVFSVPGFRVKLSALVREVGKLRNRQARKPALQFRQHALKVRPFILCRVDWDVGEML